jgi:hypothetical protein
LNGGFLAADCLEGEVRDARAAGERREALFVMTKAATIVTLAPGSLAVHGSVAVPPDLTDGALGVAGPDALCVRSATKEAVFKIC